MSFVKLDGDEKNEQQDDQFSEKAEEKNNGFSVKSLSEEFQELGVKNAEPKLEVSHPLITEEKAKLPQAQQEELKTAPQTDEDKKILIEEYLKELEDKKLWSNEEIAQMLGMKSEDCAEIIKEDMLTGKVGLFTSPQKLAYEQKIMPHQTIQKNQIRPKEKEVKKETNDSHQVSQKQNMVKLAIEEDNFSDSKIIGNEDIDPKLAGSKKETQASTIQKEKYIPEYSKPHQIKEKTSISQKPKVKNKESDKKQSGFIKFLNFIAKPFIAFFHKIQTFFRWLFRIK
jgi:hypothetical protein